MTGIGPATAARRRVREKPLPPGVLEISNLYGNQLAYTVDDGTVGRVEVSPHTVMAAREAIQRAIDALVWEPGSPEYTPS